MKQILSKQRFKINQVYNHTLQQNKNAPDEKSQISYKILSKMCNILTQYIVCKIKTAQKWAVILSTGER